jgi:hypothetical protein
LETTEFSDSSSFIYEFVSDLWPALTSNLTAGDLCHYFSVISRNSCIRRLPISRM